MTFVIKIVIYEYKSMIFDVVFLSLQMKVKCCTFFLLVFIE